MALLQNGTIWAQGRHRFIGGVLADTRSLWNRTERDNWYLGENTEDPKSGKPNGTLAPGTWILPQQSGGMASYTNLRGSGGVSAGNSAAGLNALANIAGVGSISTANAVLVIYAVANLLGSSSLTAAMLGKLEAQAALSGGGALSATITGLILIAADLDGTGTLATSLVGKLEAQAALTGNGALSAAVAGVVSLAASLGGTGALTAAILGKLEAAALLSGSGGALASIVAKAALAAGITGVGALTGGQTAIATLGANIRGYGELTPEGIRDTVWGAIMESGFSAQEILRLLAAVAAGDATGLDGNPSFKGLDDVTTRVAGTIVGGTRTITTVNGD